MTDLNLPRWNGFRHTHDVFYRGNPFPVMARVIEGAVFFYRADGLVEWVRPPGRVGWLYRGREVSDVGCREIEPNVGSELRALMANSLRATGDS